MRSLLLLAAKDAGQGDVLFLLIVLAIIAVAVGFVLWSRRRGSSAPVRRPLEEAVLDEPEPERDRSGRRRQATRAALEPEPVPEPEPAPEPEPEPEPAAPLRPEDLLPAGRTIRDGLEKTRTQGFVSRLAGLFRKDLDENIELRLEEVLVTADIGMKTAQKLLAAIRERLSRNELKDESQVFGALRQEIAAILDKASTQGTPEGEQQPLVIAVIGVNGSGKTTTIGKLAARYVRLGRKVLLVAADTFRAAAVEQLAIWAQRSNADFHSGADNQDPASVAFDGIRKGIAEGADVVIIDTAGRLHTAKNLVEELKKIVKVCGKALAGAPHETLLVLDATTGQNAIQQASIFGGEVGITGIVLTKLDGTAKGGVVIGISDALQTPVRYIGVGEKVEDLQPFSATDFVKGLFE